MKNLADVFGDAFAFIIPFLIVRVVEHRPNERIIVALGVIPAKPPLLYVLTHTPAPFNGLARQNTVFNNNKIYANMRLNLSDNICVLPFCEGEVLAD